MGRSAGVGIGWGSGGGRGEAVCACETCLLNAGADLGKLSSGLAAGFRAIFHARHVGFKCFSSHLLGLSCLFVVLRMGFNDSMIERQ